MSSDHELNPLLGIDLGTTYSAIAAWDARALRPRAYQTHDGAETLQSVVYRDPKRNELLAGQLAYRRGLLDPDNMVVGVKRSMDDASKRITLAGQEFSPVDLSAEILKRLYGDVARKYPTGTFRGKGTVVTVPYYFKAHQCENTRQAAEQAGIDCIGIIQEPIAASLLYAWQLYQANPEREFSENILVFDLGGGTFDLTLFRLNLTPKKLLFEVLATDGDDRLGGMDFDEAMVKLLLAKSGVSLEGLNDRGFRYARQKLLHHALEAKESLSAVESTEVIVPDVVPGSHIEEVVTREEFEAAIEQYVIKVERIMERLLGVADLQPAQVHRVLRVGGSSRIPRMLRILHESIGEHRVWGDVNPALCVAEGAAMYAAFQDDRRALGRDLEIEIITVASHSLGIETSGGRFYPLISRNRKTPCKQRQRFRTTEDNRTSLSINVYQGDAPLVKDNSLVGTVQINGLAPRPKGEVQVWVTFEVSQQQVLSVTVEVDGMRKAVDLKFA